MIQIEASLEEKLVEVTYMFLQCSILIAINLSGAGIYAQDTSREVHQFHSEASKFLTQFKTNWPKVAL